MGCQELKVERMAIVISAPGGMEKYLMHVGLVTHFNYHKTPTLCRVEMRDGTVLLLAGRRLAPIDMHEMDGDDAMPITNYSNRSI
ncbi:hypothetical protein CHIBITOTORO_00370 [Serratia phage vB_SmaM-ChibiTotoro]|nr:hypothetical protein CHIBITOTORO_00370 [Serratia phage vB_SmaM-ChibiTotoro]